MACLPKSTTRLTGEVYGGLQEGAPGWQWRSCRRQTWSATAYLRMLLMGLIGMRFSPDGITFQPMLPEGISQLVLPRGLAYRQQSLQISRLLARERKSSPSSTMVRLLNQPFLSAAGEGQQVSKSSFG
jgi:hypothetical protein